MVLDLTLTALLISLLIKSEAELLNGAKTLCKGVKWKWYRVINLFCPSGLKDKTQSQAMQIS